MKKNLIQIFSALIISFGLSAHQMGDFVRDIKIKPLSFSFPEIKKEFIEDGTEILSLSNTDFPIVYAEFHIYYGRKNLGSRKVESIRLLEDSWENSGSKSFPKDTLLQEFENLGAAFNLSIDYEKTVISVSYMKKDEERIVKLITSFWREPFLDADVISTTRARMADEIKRRNDNPSSLGTRKLKERVFKNTIMGLSSSLVGLESVTMDEMLKLQKEILSEKKRILLLTGDADVAKWKTYLKGLPALNEAKEKSEEITSILLSKNIENIKAKHVLVEKDVSQSFVIMMGVIPKHNDPDFYAIQVLNYIIGGGGFNSYYMREIRNNRGLAYSAGSAADFQHGYGTIHFYAMTKTESVSEVLSLMKDLLKQEFIQTIKEEELNRAKVAITNQFVFLFDDSKKVLLNELRFVDHEMQKDYLKNFRENIEKVTVEDLRRVGSKYFQPNSLSVVVVGPKLLKEKLGDDFVLIQPEDISP